MLFRSKVKREKREYSEANELLLILCHDLLSVRCGSSAEFCRDQTDRIKKCAAHFTIGQISGIIDKLKDNAERLAVSPSGGACFDRMSPSLRWLRLWQAAKIQPNGVIDEQGYRSTL